MKRLLFFFLILIFPFSSALSNTGDELEIHGFASTGFLKSRHNNYLGKSKSGMFEFNEFGINLNKNLTDNIRIGMQLYSFDLGDIGNNELKLDWAFLDYQWREYAGIKVGKFKTPLGLYNEVQDYDMLWVPVLLPQSIYTKYLRETMISTQGGALYGNQSISILGRIHYDLYTGSLDVNDGEGMSKYSNTTRVNFDTASFKDFFGSRLKWYTPLQGLMLACSTLNFKADYTGTFEALPPAPDDTFIEASIDFNDFAWIIGSIEYTRNNLILSAEYSRMDMDIEVYDSNGNFIIDMSRVRDGYYVMASYSVNSFLEVGTYYSVLYQDKDNKKGDGYLPGYEYYAWQKDYTISLRFNITDFWNIKAEHHFMNGVFLAEPDNPPTITDATIYGLTPGCEHKVWSVLALKTTFSF